MEDEKQPQQETLKEALHRVGGVEAKVKYRSTLNPKLHHTVTYSVEDDEFWRVVGLQSDTAKDSPESKLFDFVLKTDVAVEKCNGDSNNDGIEDDNQQIEGEKSDESSSDDKSSQKKEKQQITLQSDTDLLTKLISSDESLTLRAHMKEAPHLLQMGRDGPEEFVNAACNEDKAAMVRESKEPKFALTTTGLLKHTESTGPLLRNWLFLSMTMIGQALIEAARQYHEEKQKSGTKGTLFLKEFHALKKTQIRKLAEQAGCSPALLDYTKEGGALRACINLGLLSGATKGTLLMILHNGLLQIPASVRNYQHLFRANHRMSLVIEQAATLQREWAKALKPAGAPEEPRSVASDLETDSESSVSKKRTRKEKKDKQKRQRRDETNEDTASVTDC